MPKYETVNAPSDANMIEQSLFTPQYLLASQLGINSKQKADTWNCGDLPIATEDCYYSTTACRRNIGGGPVNKARVGQQCQLLHGDENIELY